jgi:hypothetical protein
MPHLTSKYNIIFTVALITQIILLLLPFRIDDFFFLFFLKGIRELFQQDIPSHMLTAAFAILTPAGTIPLLILNFWRSNFSIQHPWKSCLFFLLSVGAPLLLTVYYTYEEPFVSSKMEFLMLMSWALLGITQLSCYWLKVYTLINNPILSEEEQITQHLIDKE